MRRLTLLVVLVAFIFSSGGQWPLLQCIAWANMIREYSEMVPLGKAVEMTFSGQYPCAICKAIAEKKQSEDAKTAAIIKHEKKIVAHSLIAAEPRSTVSPQCFTMAKENLNTRSDRPPTPPPRFA